MEDNKKELDDAMNWGDYKKAPKVDIGEAPSDLLEDKDIIKEAIKENPHAIDYIPDKFKESLRDDVYSDEELSTTDIEKDDNKSVEKEKNAKEDR